MRLIFFSFFFFVFYLGVDSKAISEVNPQQKPPERERERERERAYLSTRLAYFGKNSSLLALQDTWFQVPLYKGNSFRIITINRFLTPYSKIPRVVPHSITYSSKLSAQWNLHPHVKQFFIVGYTNRKGESRSLTEQAWNAGSGFEAIWPTPWQTEFYGLVDMGTLLMNNKDFKAYFDSRYDLALWQLQISKIQDIRFVIHLNGEFNVASHMDGPGFFSEMGPRFSFKFPNQHEFSLGTNLYFSKGYPFQETTDSSSYNYYIELRGPIDGNTLSTDSNVVEDPYFPKMNMEFTGAGSNRIFIRQVTFNYIVPLLSLDKFLIQIDTNFILSNYFRREGLNVSTHHFDTGVDFLFAHPSDRPLKEKPFWRLGTDFFIHRSEHLSNPTPAELSTHFEGDSPEAAALEIASPYWRDFIWNSNRNRWIDFVSLRLRLNRFTFRNAVDDPMRSSSKIALRPGILVHFLKLKKSVFYVRGEKSLIAQDLLNWQAETGWKHPHWALFFRHENLNIQPHIVGFNRPDYYFGLKFFLFSDA